MYTRCQDLSELDTKGQASACHAAYTAVELGNRCLRYAEHDQADAEQRQSTTHLQNHRQSDGRIGVL